MTNNLNLMQSSIIKIIKISVYVDVLKILSIGYSTLTKWLKDFRESGDILARGSGNYASDEQKEIARLRRELRDAQDALDVLKKQSTFWENDGSHLSQSI
ncbi:MAG: transposase [Lachnospira sp.]